MNRITVGKENSAPIELHYEDHGTGTPVVLVHGWPLSGASWERQVSALLEAGHRVVTYDRRGFGKSSQPVTGYDYETLADDLHHVIKKLDLHDCMLVGFSMGGGEVARFLGKYGSSRVSKAVFISSITPFLLKTTDNPAGVDGAHLEQTRTAVAADRPAFLTDFFGKFYNVDVLEGSRVSREVVQYSWNIAVAASPRATLDSVRAWQTDFRGDMARIDVPTLILHGDADRILPIEATGLALAQLMPGARMVTVAGGPHGLTWTHAEQVNAELLNFAREDTPEPVR